MEVYNKSICKPRELLVEILQEYPEEVEHIFIPSCVVLTRCAGYCNDEMLECMPTSSYNITMEVSVIVYSFSSGVLCAVVFTGVGGRRGAPGSKVSFLKSLFTEDTYVPEEHSHSAQVLHQWCLTALQAQTSGSQVLLCLPQVSVPSVQVT